MFMVVFYHAEPDRESEVEFGEALDTLRRASVVRPTPSKHGHGSQRAL